MYYKIRATFLTSYLSSLLYFLQSVIMSTKAKKLKASDIPYEDNGLRYVVETASTGRSTCKRYVFVEEDNTIRYILTK